MSAHIDGFPGILTTLEVDGVAKEGRKLATLDMSVSVPKTTGTTLHTTSTQLESGTDAGRCTNQEALALWKRGLTHIRSIMKGQTTSTVSVGKITRGFCASYGDVASSFEREEWMTLQTSRHAAKDHRHERRCLRRKKERMNSNNNTSCDDKSTGRSICSRR